MIAVTSLMSLALRVRGMRREAFCSFHATRRNRAKPRTSRGARGRTIGKAHHCRASDRASRPVLVRPRLGPWAILRANVPTDRDRGGRAGRRAGRRYTTPQRLRGKADAGGRLAVAALPAAAPVEEVPRRRARARAA